MKAEHRKQLQTNVLADRMGRFVQSLKQRPQRRTVLYVVLAIAAVAAVFIFFNMRRISREKESKKWVWLDNGHEVFMAELLKDTGNAGKAATFQVAWLQYWDNGVRRLGKDHVEALRSLLRAKGAYQDLAERCKDDPLWEPEARYCLAAIEEAFAIVDRDYLNKAREKYSQVAEKFKDSAAGQRAEAKAELLKAKSPSLERARTFYADLARELNVNADKVKRDLKLDQVE